MTEARRRAAIPSSSFGHEVARTWRLLGDALSQGLDRVFELSGKTAIRRRWQLLVLVVMCVVIGIGLHVMLAGRAAATAAMAGEAGDLSIQLTFAAWRIVLLLGIAASLGLHFAGAFVADVFELKDSRVAWRFVSRLVSGTAPELLHLHGGKVADSDRTSPSLQIGGPAIVLTDDETAALFEKPDGTPRVVGPTSASSRNGRSAAGVWLDGFERLREP
ncbi:MAG TPA: hypothetical protein VFH29_07585, partial [Anaerolineales bacterium]|nr:hypothetical protein [Anaerolineales bacterium]